MGLCDDYHRRLWRSRASHCSGSDNGRNSDDDRRRKVDNDDDNLGNDDNLDDEYTFLHTDNSDKTRKSFRRASVDAINKSLETLNINDFNVSTTMSFSEHQFKRSDKEIHMMLTIMAIGVSIAPMLY